MLLFGGRESIFRLICRGVPSVPTILMVGQSNGSFWKSPGKEKKTVGAPPH